MPKAIVIHKYGGPEEFRYEEVPVGKPGPGEVRLRHTAIGVNYIDVYHRTGLYPVDGFPAIVGMEGAGVVEAVGEGVTEVKPGDRVAYSGHPRGAYCEARVMPAERLVKLPPDIGDRQAAAMMLQGLTVRMLLEQVYPVKKGDTILIHAAAGGVGLIACQWAKHLGATVIGTVGSHEKAELAKAHGCDYPILYREVDFVARVKEITNGKMVPVVYDSVGKDTFEKSLDCLARRGVLASFGNASGKAPPLDVTSLGPKGALWVTRPTIFAYNATREEYLANTARIFEVVQKGAVKIEARHTYPLEDAAQAHRDLEARRTTGSIVLIP
jgi:NADPH2:quinone reductase